MRSSLFHSASLKEVGIDNESARCLWVRMPYDGLDLVKDIGSLH